MFEEIWAYIQLNSCAAISEKIYDPIKSQQINIEISFKTKQTITLDSTCFRPNLIF